MRSWGSAGPNGSSKDSEDTFGLEALRRHAPMDFAVVVAGADPREGARRVHFQFLSWVLRRRAGLTEGFPAANQR